ncbi:HAD family hydrolase [Janibacter hoylei]|uniref:HAD family hydrolase n=1 Tax=Janibacter hoylei TaxID=364298 RepID=UPI0027B8A7DB|nr:HAD-IA family hydrolase [Janibacter hoylei]
MRSPQELLDEASAVLLDFDGPLTALMPSPLNAQAAERARAALRNIDLPEDIAATTDHLAVLRFAVNHHPDRALTVESACTDAEVQCARLSEPSPEASFLVEQAESREIPLAIVSNNSTSAVRVFLDRFGWTSKFAALSCRESNALDRLKPDPYLVKQALRLLAITPHRAVFVGDSLSDVDAGHAAKVAVIGLAKSPTRATQLEESGADAVIHRQED